jgi:Winged helix DNA-binding domain
MQVQPITRDIALQRLTNQQIAQPSFTHPSEVVQWLGAVQAQDYLGALWAVGLRTRSATEQTIEQALAEKTIVRTWPMRGTIHFVAPADVRWMLEVLTPRVVQRSKRRLTELGLDEKIIAASAEVIAKGLQGGRQLPRPALYELLEQANIVAGGQRGLHILGQLAQRQLICFGARAGKQPTFTLLDEWAPGAKSLPRDEALAELARRYFTGHGPATLQDFIWWAGLTTADAKAGLGAAAAQLERELIGAQEYYFAPELPPAPGRPLDASLLPPFDEFLVGYRDRSASLDAEYNTRVVPGGNGIFNPIVVIDGRVVGTWKRTFKKDTVVMNFSPFTSWNDEQVRAISAAAECYGRFVNKTAVVAI